MTPPVFGHGELRLVLLTLIAREPRHGYDLIHALNDHFAGDYSPSAGTIYPRLAKLQEEGLVTKTQDGRKTIYTITDAGKREVEERGEEFERVTIERTDAVRSIAQSARHGLAQARRGLRDELDLIARQARAAAEDALHRERAATEAEEAAKATVAAQARAAEAERAANERVAHAEQRAHDQAKSAEQHVPAQPPEASDAPATEPDPALVKAQFIRRVDVALQQFRMELRQDAREANQIGGLDEEIVGELETQLNEVRRQLGSLMRVHR